MELSASYGHVALPRPCQSRLSTIHNIVIEARPAVQAVFLMRFASVAVIGMELTSAVALAVIGWLHVTSAIYVLNGLSDLEGDRCNGSQRPLASGLVSVHSARAAVWAFTVIGVTLCWLASLAVAALSLVILALGVCYSYGPSWKADRRTASWTIGAAAGVTYCAGAAASGSATTALVVYIVALSTWIAFASNTKDFSDVVGDRTTGRRTWPVELGPARASNRVLITTAAAAIGLAAASATSATFLIATSVIAVGTIALGIALRSVSTARTSQPTRRPYKVYMLTQYSACASMMVSVA